MRAPRGGTPPTPQNQGAGAWGAMRVAPLLEWGMLWSQGA